MPATKSNVFTGPGNVGVSMFGVDEFYVDRESVYLNGARLTRNIDYSISDTDPADSTTYDLIILDANKYPTGIVNSTDIVEVVTEVIEPYVPDPMLQDILSLVTDIATATYGSWRWNKRDGILTMYDNLGNERFKFNVSDDAEAALRERRQDLEV